MLTFSDGTSQKYCGKFNNIYSIEIIDYKKGYYTTSFCEQLLFFCIFLLSNLCWYEIMYNYGTHLCSKPGTGNLLPNTKPLNET